MFVNYHSGHSSAITQKWPGRIYMRRYGQLGLSAMIMQNDRKGSEDQMDSEDEGTQLFPRHPHSSLTQTLELLAEHYDPIHHANSLANCCFKCHNSQIYQPYETLRQKIHQQLTEPPLSLIYANSQFVDLRKLVWCKTEPTLRVPDPCIEPFPRNLSSILDALFERYGYVPNLERLLLFYPAYLEKHRVVEADLFESGKVESKSAYFVALCAAAEMGSVYMMARYIRHYLRTGGSKDWFKPEHFPRKFKLLGPLNRMMARSPWDITPEMIEQILENEQIQSWNRSELARYVQIMAFAHQNSTIALSMGLLPEQETYLQLFNMKKIQQKKEEYDSVVYQSGLQNEKLAVMIPILKEYDEGSGEEKEEFKRQIRASRKDIKKDPKRNEVDVYMKEINNELTKQQLYYEINELVRPLLPEYEAIEKRGESKNNVVDYSEYNYKFMAYPILNSLTHDTADKIENLISHSEIMTRGNFGSEKINHTKEFRKAVRYYAENLCGFTHHEYDFKSNVGAYLTMALKFYIRLVAMSPLHINPQVVKATNHEKGETMECFDLGHLAVLIANSKMSLQLTMAVQAFDL